MIRRITSFAMTLRTSHDFIISATDNSSDLVPDEEMCGRLSAALADDIPDNEDFLDHFS